MADPLELEVTNVPLATELHAYVWFRLGTLEGLTERPVQLSDYGFTSNVHSRIACYSLEMIQGAPGSGLLKPDGFMGDKYGLKGTDDIKGYVGWNRYASPVYLMDCLDEDNPDASLNAHLCSVEANWGDPNEAPYWLVSDFEGDVNPPPGVEPPCQGGDGSERPEFGMIYPRKI